MTISLLFVLLKLQPMGARMNGAVEKAKLNHRMTPFGREILKNGPFIRRRGLLGEGGCRSDVQRERQSLDCFTSF